MVGEVGRSERPDKTRVESVNRWVGAGRIDQAPLVGNSDGRFDQSDTNDYPWIGAGQIDQATFAE